MECVFKRVPDSGQNFVSDVVRVQGRNRIDHVVLNAGILKYPNVSVASVPLTVVTTWTDGVTL